MNVSVVIPSNREEVLTTESLPASVDDVQVRRDPGLNRARNAGVADAAHESVVILDDDLAFEASWFRDLVEAISEATVQTAAATGILPRVTWPRRFEPGMGRVLAFPKRAWRDVGGFPEPCSHGGDTDFLMAAWEAGYEIVPLEHEWDHRDDDVDAYGLRDNLEWLWFLLRRHPRLVGPRLPAIAYRKVVG